MRLPVNFAAILLLANHFVVPSLAGHANKLAISDIDAHQNQDDDHHHHHHQGGGGLEDDIIVQDDDADELGAAAAAVAQGAPKWRAEPQSGPAAGRTRARRHIRLVTLELPPFMMRRRHREANADDVTSGNPKKTAPNASTSWPSSSSSSSAPREATGAAAAAAGKRAAANETVEWYGYCMDFFLELIKHLPYEVSYDIREVTDGKFGSKTREIIATKGTPGSGRNASSGKPPPPPPAPTEFKRVESWNGLVGELANGRAEVALAPMAVMAERELVIDFTVPFYDLVGIQILLKRPEVPQDWFKFLTVLDNDVWFSIGLAYFVTSFVIYIFDRLSPYSHKNLTRIKRMKAKRASEMHEIKLAQRQQNGHLGAIKLTKFEGLAGGNGGKFSLLRGEISRPPTALNGHLVSSREAREPIQTVSGQQRPAESGLVAGRVRYKHLGALSSAAPPAPILPGGQLLTLEMLSAANGPIEHHKPPLAVDDADDDANVLRPRSRRPSQEHLHQLRQRFAPTRRKSATGNSSASKGDDDSEGDSADDDDGGGGGGDKPDFNFRDSLWFCITSLTPQGGGEAPQNLSGRVVAGAWWLFCFIVIASYTANLAAFLTVSRLDIPIESLDDLAKQYRIKYSPIDGTAEQTYFERMAYIEEIFYNIWKEMSLNDSLSEEERSKFSVWDYPISDKYTKIWSQIQEVSMPATSELALARVKASNLEDGFALLADANLIKYAVMTDCSLKAVGEEFSRKPIALALAKGHEQLRDDISYAILQLINKRFMETLREKWWTNNPARVVCDTNDESEGISIENIGGVFIIILAGILLSFLAWAIERFAYNSKVDMSRTQIEQPQPSKPKLKKAPI